MKSDYRSAFTATLIALAAICGCCKPEVEYRRVEVPVPVACPEPPELRWPDLPIRLIDLTSPPDQVVRAYALSVAILKVKLQEAYALLDGYRVNSQKTMEPVKTLK